MAAVAIHQLAECITCHAWSPDRTSIFPHLTFIYCHELSRLCPAVIAFCPNNNEVHIVGYQLDKWECVHVLEKHDQLISGIDWGEKSNHIVTVSHDRNSYVWHQGGSEWIPTLVILRLNRAALCVRWSPEENKFAVGSGATTVCICYYDKGNDWWVSKLIRKKHNSSVTSVAWHPNNIHLATTSTDGKCRIFSTFIKGIDTKDSTLSSLSGDSKFGEQVVQLDLSVSWTYGVKWSPSGSSIAYAGHNSTLYFIDDVGPVPSAQSVECKALPLCDLIFVSERMVIGVGFDCKPMVFTADGSGTWSFVRFLDERKMLSTNFKYGSQLSGRFGKLYGSSKQGGSGVVVQPSRAGGGAHDNCINCIMPMRSDGETVKQCSTSGLDGKIVIWDIEF